MSSKVFIVLGPPRSGTSLVAGILHASGIDMGAMRNYDASFRVPGDQHNPTGYYEENVITAFSDDVLKKAGGGVIDPPLDEDIVTVTRHSIDAMKRYIKNRASRGCDWGWKDPRTVLLWPVFVKLLVPEYSPHLIFTHRNPLHNARSLQRRYGFETIYLYSIVLEYINRIGNIASENYYPALHLAFEDWWYRFDEQSAALSKFVGRELCFDHFRSDLWRS